MMPSTHTPPRRWARWLLLALALLLTLPIALGGGVSGWTLGDAPPWAGRPQTPLAYHPVTEGSFSEGWVTVVNQDDGGYVLILTTLFHVGPLRYHQGIAVFAYLPTGERLFGSGSRRGASGFLGQASPYHIEMGNNSWGGAFPSYGISLELDTVAGEIALTQALPPVVPGTGQARLKGEGSFGLTHVTPWARATGRLRFGERVVDIAGDAYAENLYGEPIPPDFSERWDLLRYFGEGYALTIVNITLRPSAGGGALRSLVLSPAGGPSRVTQSFTLEPEGPLGDRDPRASRAGGWMSLKTDPESGVDLRGQVRVGRILEAVDLLGALPIFVRILAGTLYGRPYHHRYEAEVDLTLREGSVDIPLKGRGFGEAHLYEP